MSTTRDKPLQPSGGHWAADSAPKAANMVSSCVHRCYGPLWRRRSSFDLSEEPGTAGARFVTTCTASVYSLLLAVAYWRQVEYNHHHHHHQHRWRRRHKASGRRIWSTLACAWVSAQQLGLTPGSTSRRLLGQRACDWHCGCGVRRAAKTRHRVARGSGETQRDRDGCILHSTAARTTPP